MRKSFDGAQILGRHFYIERRIGELRRNIVLSILILVSVFTWVYLAGPEPTITQWREMFAFTLSAYIWLKCGAPFPRIRRSMPAMEADPDTFLTAPSKKLSKDPK